MSAKNPTEKVRQKNRQKVVLDSRSFWLERDLTGGHDNFPSPSGAEHNLPIRASRFDSTQKQDALGRGINKPLDRPQRAGVLGIETRGRG
jgi:hypothetical protein